MLSKIAQLYNTVKHLKAKQIRYQIQYRLDKPKKLTAYEQHYKNEEAHFLHFVVLPPVFASASENNNFEFLNLRVAFGNDIDWGYSTHGKLWNYNLQYANYLLQTEVPLEKRLEWLRSLHSWLQSGKLPVEPYPASLRAINTIRLLSHEQLLPADVLKALQAEIYFLYLRPEYHLLGNHLLENAFALMMGGAFFGNNAWITKGQQLLQTELEEQVLNDGAHFELSPMYHQIILFRLLELLDWYSKWEEKQASFEKFLRGRAVKMVSWLQQITFANGDIPHFNDSAEGIAYNSAFLLKYAEALGIESDKKLCLSGSGYRKFRSDRYECVVDAAEIGPTYQAGHGHADALSFILYYKKKPVLVEAGTSTYEMGNLRAYERSTQAHNTVVINNLSQSDVWGGFRVGNRANILIHEDSDTNLVASHDGYLKSLKAIHERSFTFSPLSVTIIDTVTKDLNCESIAYFHLYPGIEFIVNDTCLEMVEVGVIKFSGLSKLEYSNFNFANGYNKYLMGTVFKIYFNNKLETKISFV